jgi:hypothetical protein
MKRLFSSVCLIICLPILFAGSAQIGGRHLSNPGSGVAMAYDIGALGNCVKVHHKLPAQPMSESTGSAVLPTSFGPELAALADVLMTWVLRL